MNNINLVDLTTDEMLMATGGLLELSNGTYCFLGGFTAVVGLATGNPLAATAGVWFAYRYC